MQMDWEPWIHFTHVASAMVWVGGGIMLTVIGTERGAARIRSYSTTSAGCSRTPACASSCRRSSWSC